MEKLPSYQSQNHCSYSSLPTLQCRSKELVSNIYLKAVSTYDQFSVWAILFWSAFIHFIRDIAQVSIVETTWDSFINRMWRTFLPLKTHSKFDSFKCHFILTREIKLCRQIWITSRSCYSCLDHPQLVIIVVIVTVFMVWGEEEEHYRK